MTGEQVQGATARGAASTALLTGARALAVDAVTGEVVSAFKAAGIRSIVLKGPSIAGWLYEGAPRLYVDSDLLVAPHQLAAAHGVLAGLDFAPPPSQDVLDIFSPQSARTWVRRAGAGQVDLHHTLVGVEAEPAETWTILAESTTTMRVGGADVEVLNLQGRAVHIALHAAQHGILHLKPLHDLARALEQLSEEGWRRAAATAERLEATGAFATGLRLIPEGAALAARLGLPNRPSVQVALRSRSASRAPVAFALAVEGLVTASGPRGKLVYLARKLAPPAVVVRERMRREGKEPMSLPAAYLWRLALACRDALPGLATWWRARKEIG
ncbi:hypothetical protein BH20ACT23_BH20ACT23_14540 [soil metagenome]